jgi:S1-C subfamily serine protease
MIRISGQSGVPVITVDDQVVVGFDRRRLEQLLSKPEGAPKLGAVVGDAASRLQVPGAFVGRVAPGSLAEKAGLRGKDVIVEIAGTAVNTAADLEHVLAGLHQGEAFTLVFLRDGQRVQVQVQP